MNKKLVTLFILTTLLVLPIVAFATLFPDLNLDPKGSFDITAVINNILLGLVWPIFGAIAILMFIFAGFLFLTANGDPTKISSAKKALMWGIIGTAVALLAEVIPFIINDLL